MDDTAKTIGMDVLLQEISDRLSFLKEQKHPKAYDIALWWEQEKQMIGLKYSIRA